MPTYEYMYIHTRARGHTHTHTHAPTPPHTPLHPCAHPHTHIVINMSGNPLFSLLFVVTVYGLEIGQFATVQKRQKVWILGRQNFVPARDTYWQTKKQKKTSVRSDFQGRSISNIYTGQFLPFASDFRTLLRYLKTPARQKVQVLARWNSVSTGARYMQARRKKKTTRRCDFQGRYYFLYIFTWPISRP